MPQARPWIAWDAEVTGFGVKVQPTGTKSFIVNYRARGGGRTARNRRVVIGGADWMAPDHARRRARELLDRVARGEDPVEERTAAHTVPTLSEAFREYLEANPDRKESTARFYRGLMRNCLGDWLTRPLGTIARRDVEARFHLVSCRRRGGALSPGLEAARPDRRQPCDLPPALGVSPALRGLRQPEEPRRAVARRGRALPPERTAAHLRAVRGAPALAPGHRGGGGRAGDPRHLLVRAVHRHARRRGFRPALGPREPPAAHAADRRDQDRGAAGTADHAAACGRPRAAPGRLPGRAREGNRRRTAARLGVPLSDQRLRARGRTRAVCDFSTCTAAFPGRRERSSGSTGSATASSRSRSANSCCRARSRNGW